MNILSDILNDIDIKKNILNIKWIIKNNMDNEYLKNFCYENQTNKYMIYILGYIYFIEGEIDLSLCVLQENIKLNEDNSLFLLAHINKHYFYGNTNKVIPYYEKAAMLGNNDAKLNLAYHYEMGIFVKQDKNIALDYFAMSIEDEDNIDIFLSSYLRLCDDIYNKKRFFKYLYKCKNNINGKILLERDFEIYSYEEKFSNIYFNIYDINLIYK